MKNRFLSLVFFLCAVMTALGQGITRQDADSILKSLKKDPKGIDRIDLLLNLAQFHIFKPGELKIDFDSAMVYINEAKILNKSVKSTDADGYQLLTESYLIKEKGQKKEGQKIAEKAVKILEAGHNKYYLARACYELSMYYGYEEPQQLLQKLELVGRSVEAFKQAGKLERNAYTLEMLGDLYLMSDSIDKGIQVLNQALTAHKSVNYPKLQGVYVLLGQAYQFKNNESQSLYYMLNALKTANLVHDTSMQLCQINNTLGTLYVNIGRSDISIKYMVDALKIAKKYNDESAIFLLSTNIIYIYNNLDQPELALEALTSIPNSILQSDQPLTRARIAMAYLRTYTENKQYSKAQPYCDTVLKLAGNNKFRDQTMYNIYHLLAAYYTASKQYAKAKYYLVKNRSILERTSLVMGKAQDSKLWYKLDSAQGNFQSAFTYLHFYKANQDSLYSVNRTKQQQVLAIEYETAIKEDSIKAMDQNISYLTRTNNLQQANLKQASLIKNITIGGIILAFILIILLYRQYLHKQKSNLVITQKNDQLQHFLAEKEWLLKEIHHRVKNNLQIVMSLLNSQSAYIDNQPALTAIHDSQHRVHAMSLIHQKLYNSENLSSIEMSFYIRELASYLADSFSTGQRIRFEFDIESLEMDVSQAVPLGLILNEAITNAIKYAFPDGRSGVISIALSTTTPHHYLLSISDTGIGMPSHLTNKKPGSLGMSLMAGLSEDLDGSFSIESNNGTTIKISFVHDLSVRRPGIVATSFVSSNN